MARVENDGALIWYTVDGREDAPAVLLLHSLGTTHELWNDQLPVLRDAYHVIRYDMRGHGRSTAPPGEFTIEQLGADALAVLDVVNARSAAICGISIGGITSVWLGQYAHDRVDRLVLANTAARIGTSESWSMRIRDVRAEGMNAAAEQAMTRWFSSDFRARRPDVVARFLEMARSCALDSYLGACAALRDTDLRRDLHRITAPTLVIAGRVDPSTTVADAEYLRDNIPSARMEALEAAHLSNVERPEEFSELLTDFLKS
jgi:3-oxoadipate enol-lactonase